MTPLLWALPKNRLSFLCAEKRLPQSMRGAPTGGRAFARAHSTLCSRCRPHVRGRGSSESHRVDPSSPRPPPRSESTTGLALQHRLESGEYRAAGPVCPATARHHVNMAAAALIPGAPCQSPLLIKFPGQNPGAVIATSRMSAAQPRMGAGGGLRRMLVVFSALMCLETATAFGAGGLCAEFPTNPRTRAQSSPRRVPRACCVQRGDGGALSRIGVCQGWAADAW